MAQDEGDRVTGAVDELAELRQRMDELRERDPKLHEYMLHLLQLPAAERAALLADVRERIAAMGER